MANVKPLEDGELPEALNGVFQMVEAGMGFLPNSMKTMARWPELLGSFAPFAGAVLRGGEVDIGLKQMVAAISSKAAGCRYCQAHTTHGAAHAGGIASAKLAELWEYQTSEQFTEAERAALDLALAASQVPNAADKSHFSALRTHFSDREIVEIVAVISLFGFLNRWNDTMATTLEDEPVEFATALFDGDQWAPGKHAA